MTVRQEVEILYLYIVEGESMDRVADRTGWSTGEVSDTVRGYGFNNDGGARVGWQSGKDRGRYSRGSSACQGVNVDRNVIQTYCNSARRWNWDFEAFLEHYGRPARQQAERQRQQAERQRQAEEEARRNRARYEQQQREREAERQRQAAEAARQERIRQEQARQEAERQRWEREQRQRDWNNHKAWGKAALQQNRILDAHKELTAAERICNDDEVQLLMAEVYARSGNANEHAQGIINRLLPFVNSDKPPLTAQQELWLAAAYLAADNRDRACDAYFRAGDLHYVKNNFKEADRIYTEGREKTQYYSAFTPDAAFRIAYARSKTRENMTEADHSFCESWYKTAIERKQQTLYARANRAHHLINLKRYDEAVKEAEAAISGGLQEPYAYKNLLTAQRLKKDYDGWRAAMSLARRNNVDVDAKWQYERVINKQWIDDEWEELRRTINEAKAKGLPVPPREEAECLRHEGRPPEEALACYDRALAVKSDDAQTLLGAWICQRDLAEDAAGWAVAAHRGLKWLAATKKRDTDGYRNNRSILLRDAERSDNSAFVNQVLAYWPEEKERRDTERRKAEQERREREEAERRRREEALRQRLAEERRQAEEAQKRREEEARKAEEARRKAEEERKRREEAARKAEQERQKAEAAEKKRRLEEEMLMLLF